MNPMLKNVIRVGKVSSIQPEKCTARVAFEDRGGTVSPELPILVRGSLQNRDYWMPDPNEHVVCLFLPSGNAQGFIIGSIYSKADPSPVQDENKRHISFSDGTMIEYDRKTHTLTIDAKGPINITATQDIIVHGDVIADGVSLKKHTHIQTPGAETGPPVGGS